VPPVPWRKLAVGAVLGLAFAGVALALIVPPLERAKREGAARDARKQAAIVAAEVERLRVDQRVHRVSPRVAGGGLVGALEAAITADAKGRVTAGSLDGPILGTSCEAASRNVVIHPGTRVYKCVALTTGYKPGKAGVSWATGYPFIATVDFRKHTLTWCKTNPQPGEKTRGHGIARVLLSPECAGTLAKLI
jgi:hypothetical protein